MTIANMPLADDVDSATAAYRRLADIIELHEIYPIQVILDISTEFRGSGLEYESWACLPPRF